PDGSGPVLYVPQRADNRIAAFPIDPVTGLSTVPTVAPDGSPISDAHGSSCILGPMPSEWEDVLAANGVLYSARSTSRGEVIVYKLNPDGNFADGILVVNEAVSPNLNSMCTRRKGCTTGVACTSDANCVQPGQACGAGVCVDTSGPECSKDSDCPGQTCQSVGPCDQNNRVYRVSSADCTTPIDLVDSQGQVILNQAGNAVSKRAQIQPWAIRRRLNGVSTIILRDNVLYVSERFRKAISALEVCPNAFTPKCDPAGTDSGAFFTGPDALVAEATAALEDTCPAGGFFSQPKRTKKGKCTDQFRQPRLAKPGGRTLSNIRYNALALAEGMPGAGATIIGAQFLDGRIDGYRLRDGDLLPNDPTSRTKDDFRTSPF